MDAPSPDHELTEEEFQAIYGPVAPLTPEQARELLVGAPFRWWIVGGWSTELDVSSPRRQHTDLELSVARHDLDALRAWLPDHHFWDIHDGTLTFLSTGKGLAGEEHEQVWVRRDAFSPWILDLLLTPVEADTWLYKRDRRLTMPMSQLIVERDGVPYQRPEIALLFKARRRAPRDEEDFAAVVPLLPPRQRAWLRDAIALTEPPDNPWLDRL
jgi:hypothetical protein